MSAEGGFLTSSQLRRLPVYLLLDCSSSMMGDPITAVNEGVTMLHRELSNDPRALETVFISIITFATRADQYKLTSLAQFQPPTLVANGSTPMGEAFKLLAQSIEQDLIQNTPTQHGDYRPLVFLLTDGEPTDSYRDAIQKLHSLHSSRKPTIVALGCGSQVNTAMLHEVTENVFLMHNVTAASIRQYFQWISGSIAQASQSVGSSANQQTVITPPTSIPGINYSPQ